jgi:coenzyme PQQ precursor peptide PqqA
MRSRPGLLPAERGQGRPSRGGSDLAEPRHRQLHGCLPSRILGPNPCFRFVGNLTKERRQMKKWSTPKAIVVRLGMEINSYVAHR